MLVKDLSFRAITLQRTGPFGVRNFYNLSDVTLDSLQKSKWRYFPPFRNIGPTSLPICELLNEVMKFSDFSLYCALC